MVRRPVHVALIVVQVLFATAPIAVKIALRELSSPSLALLRAAAAAVLFVVLQQVLVRERVLSRGDYARLAWYALFGVVANQLLYITALTRTTATAAQTLVTAGPALTLLIAIILRRETASAGKWLGIGLAAAGALYLVGVDVGTGRAAGNLLVLLNVVAFSVYLVISRDLLGRYDPLTVITWVFLFGALGIAPLGVPSIAAEPGGLSLATWLSILWIVLGPTVGAYYLNQWALHRVEASTVALYVYLQPIITAMLAFPILGERPSPRLIPAAALIFLGVWVSSRFRTKPLPPPAV
ncbi:MAG: DMT family transporter [Gemmatimonadetes bacterium]|nr:DMT family transporter [Gemmatimonadota bacterium]